MEQLTFQKPELLDAGLMALLEPLVAAARRNVEENDDLVPVAFVGKTTAKAAIQLPAHLSDNPKVRSMFVRIAADAIDADFAIVFEETWLFESNGKTRDEAIAERKKYENVRDMPGAYVALMMILETPNGAWMAQPRITSATVPRTMASPVEFRIIDGFEGTFAGLLPRKGQAQ